MGAKPAPNSPSGGPSASGPITTASGVCCWCEDYQGEISVNASNRYSRRIVDGKAEGGGRQRRYLLQVLLKSRRIRVVMRYKVVGFGSTAAEHIQLAERELVSGVESWNGKITIEIDDPECGKQQLPVEFEAPLVSSGQHYTVELFQTVPSSLDSGRPHVTGDFKMRVDWATRAWTFSHEHGHCFGLPDEYGYSNEAAEQIVYIRPDGGSDPPIDIDALGTAGSGPDVTIMSTHSQHRRRVRHGYCIAIEVQQLLTRRLGRTIRCKVVRPPT